MKPNRLLYTNALILALFCTSHAHSAATATASIYDLSLTLIDLDPTDSISPSMTLENATGSAYQMWSIVRQQHWDGTIVTDESNAFDQPDNFGYFSPYNTLSAATDKGASTSESTSNALSTKASYSISGDHPSDVELLEAYAFIDISKNFTLSSKTLLLISGKYTVTAALDEAELRREYVGASVGFRGNFQDGGNSLQYFDFYNETHAPTLKSPKKSKSGIFGFSLVNFTNETGSGQFSVTISSTANVSPVPEVNALILTLAGALIAANSPLIRAKRRQNNPVNDGARP